MISVLLEYTPPNQKKFIEVLDKLLEHKFIHVTVFCVHKDQLKNLKKYLVKLKKAHYVKILSTRIVNIRHWPKVQVIRMLNDSNIDIFIAAFNREGSDHNYHTIDDKFWKNLSTIYDMKVTEKFLHLNGFDGTETFYTDATRNSIMTLTLEEILDDYDNFVESAYAKV